MSNLMLGHRNYVNDATLTGGTYQSTPYGRANMQSSWTSQVARTDGKTTAATKVLLDMGAAVPVRVISEQAHNFPVGGLRKVSAGTASGASNTYAGSWHSVWGISFSDTGIPFPADGAWWGNGLDTGVYGCPYMGCCVLPSTITARYWTIEWDVTSSTADHLQIGRLFAGPVIQPEFNAVVGMRHGKKDTSVRQPLESGGVFTRPGRVARTARFNLPVIGSGDEEYLFDQLQRYARTANDILYVPNPERLALTQVKGFLGNLDSLDDTVWAARLRREIQVSLTERL